MHRPCWATDGVPAFLAHTDGPHNRDNPFAPEWAALRCAGKARRSQGVGPGGQGHFLARRLAVLAPEAAARRSPGVGHTESGITTREKAIGIDVGKREAEVHENLATERARLVTLEARWTEERGLLDELLALQGETPLIGAGRCLVRR